MADPSNYLIPLIFLAFPAIFLLHYCRKSGGRFPPGPRGWPIIGNLLHIGRLPHRTLNDMKQKHGDIIGLKLGSIKTIVILSSKAASELFKNHDLVFADRIINQSMRIHGFNDGALALLPHGSHWRVLRKLVMVDMLSNKELNETSFIRRKCVDDMLRWIEKETLSEVKAESGINISHFVFLMTFNLMGNLVFSRDVLDPESKECSEFMKAVLELLDFAVNVDIVDFIPWLKWVMNMQGVEKRRKMERGLGEAMELASRFVKQRIEEKKMKMIENRSKDFLDVLIEFEGNGKDEPQKISEHNMQCFVLEMYVAVTENVSSTIEWAMTELLRNPEAMRKAKAELSSIIAPNMKVEENDINTLPYLQSIIKETLRLHTPVPLLLPKKTREDTKFMGYDIPKNTQVFVNAWAIARDPEVWDDPLSFKPERFMDSKVDFKGQHFEFIPFGAGRRLCVGLSLAHRVLNLILGSLLHHFDWELAANVNPESMDMREILGITMRKLEPLLVVPKKKNINM
ncbi:cytochrome P450 76A1-like [Euphorbia lathyris]|uniref:cytochrome P450 76A1-like n=1 Tax=Euphorbia lathyris TaxID=212925 RepID=UPI00331416B5